MAPRAAMRMLRVLAATLSNLPVSPGGDRLAGSPERPIFLVDDEADDWVLFQRLQHAAAIRHPCAYFSCGEEMIDALIAVLRGAACPLACFLDVKMPGMSGFDVLRWIRCQRGLDAVAVIMLSASNAPNDLSEALNSGAQCYIAKFPTPAQLREIVQEAARVAAAATANPFRLPCNLLLANSPASCR